MTFCCEFQKIDEYLSIEPKKKEIDQVLSTLTILIFNVTRIFMHKLLYCPPKTKENQARSKGAKKFLWPRKLPSPLTPQEKMSVPKLRSFAQTGPEKSQQNLKPFDFRDVSV